MLPTRPLRVTWSSSSPDENVLSTTGPVNQNQPGDRLPFAGDCGTVTGPVCFALAAAASPAMALLRCFRLRSFDFGDLSPIIPSSSWQRLHLALGVELSS